MLNKKAIKATCSMLGAALLISGATAYAGTSYSSYSTVTLGKFSSVWPVHPNEQTKSETNLAGDITVSSVGGNYQVYARMTQKDVNGYWQDDGSNVTISTGDKKKLPSKSSHYSGYATRCYFNTSATTYVDVNCTSKWRSN